MKTSVSSLFAVAVSFAFLGCGKEKTKAPDPNPVGQWKWSDPAQGSVRLDVNAGAKFQREITSPVDPKPSQVSGTWSLKVLDSETKGGPDDALMRSAGYDASKESSEWSALGTLTLTYSVPQGAKLEPGVRVLESKGGGAMSKAPETPVEEKRIVRTRTDKGTGEVALDMEGKTFHKFDGPALSITAAQELKEKAGSKAAAMVATPTTGSVYLRVEPFAGITLELPDNWKALEPGASEKLMLSMTNLVGKQRELKTNTTWIFVPPGNVADVNITLSVQPPLMSPAEMAAASQAEVDRFAVGFSKSASGSLGAKGYLLKPGAKAERVSIGNKTAMSCVGEATNRNGGKMIIQSLAIATEKAMVVMGFTWADAPGTAWEGIMKHASASVQISDNVAAPAQ